jgi:predicted ATPase
MNERIRQLAEQALFESDFDDEQNIKITMDIFAELIVRECVATLTKLGNAYKGSEESEYEFGDFHYMQGILDSADVIKEHFGVKDERTNS